jgi:hypothetical protein
VVSFSTESQREGMKIYFVSQVGLELTVVPQFDDSELVRGSGVIGGEGHAGSETAIGLKERGNNLGGCSDLNR